MNWYLSYVSAYVKCSIHGEGYGGGKKGGGGRLRDGRDKETLSKVLVV